MVMLISDLDIVKVLLRRLVLQYFQLISVRFGHYALECPQILASLEVYATAIRCQVKNFLCLCFSFAGLSNVAHNAGESVKATIAEN